MHVFKHVKKTTKKKNTKEEEEEAAATENTKTAITIPTWITKMVQQQL